jgi:Ca2+/H+ antiporter
VPFVTIVGWILGHPFSLGFDPFAALVLLLSVMHSAHMINDAESHWCVLKTRILSGRVACLLACLLLISTGAAEHCMIYGSWVLHECCQLSAV